MKRNKELVVHLPKKFVDALKIRLKENPPYFKYKMEYFYYIFHHILNLQNRRKRRDFQKINMVYLQNVTIANIRYLITYLKKENFILTDNHYIKGKKSFHYKINNDFFSDEVEEFVIARETKLGQKFFKEQQKSKANDNKLPYHLRLMKKEFERLDFDYENAFKWIAENNVSGYKKIAYLNSLEALKSGVRYFKRNKTNNRLDTNLTSLKKDFKQFMKGDFVSIDLKNSQPYLLGVLARQNLISPINHQLIHPTTTHTTPLCCFFSSQKMTQTFGTRALQKISKIHKTFKKENKINFDHYFSAVSNGVFYEEFMKEYKEKLSRSEIKDVVFSVLFSKNHELQNKKKVFATLYPFLEEVIKVLKEKDYRNLSIYLQKIESYLFIDCISKELVENGIIPFTIHDFIIVKKEYQEKTLQIMKDVFLREIGCVGTFDVEVL